MLNWCPRWTRHQTDRPAARHGRRRPRLRHRGQRLGTHRTRRREYEHSRTLRRMRNGRVGIEARISHLKRTFGLRRTRLRRLSGAQTRTGFGIFAYNLQWMAVVS
ncbi:transposase [Streptomyces sp. NBC_01614]